MLILSAFLLLLFSKFFLPLVSPFREGGKAAHQLTEVAQTAANICTGAKQVTNGLRSAFLGGYSLYKFPSVPLISSPRGLGAESGVESARAAPHCSEARASFPEEILNK